MHGTHWTIASFTLILGAGTMIVLGSACVLWSQVLLLADLRKSRGRLGDERNRVKPG